MRDEILTYFGGAAQLSCRLNTVHYGMEGYKHGERKLENGIVYHVRTEPCTIVLERVLLTRVRSHSAIYLKIHVNSCVCVCGGCTCVFMSMCAKVRGLGALQVPSVFFFFFLVELHSGLVCAKQARLIGQSAPGTACLRLPGTGILSESHRAQLLKLEFCGLSSRPRVCQART